MNREIKFRVWDKAENEWVYNLGMKVNNVVCDGTEKRFSVMQYTGLKDANGVEVYEGDIVSSSQWNPKEYKIVFQDGEFGFLPINDNGDNWINPIHYVRYFSVIGNIYENPELLTQ